MKFKIVIALLSVLLATTAEAKRRHHTDGLNQVGNTDEMLVCMAGKVQGDIQPACQPINQRFFNVRVYTPYYNPEATARVRQGVLNTAKGAAVNQEAVTMIIERYGRSFQE
ncbi:TPA: hypothetical protein ACXIBN_003424 [Proteus mirabilis]